MAIATAAGALDVGGGGALGELSGSVVAKAGGSVLEQNIAKGFTQATVSGSIAFAQNAAPSSPNANQPGSATSTDSYSGLLGTAGDNLVPSVSQLSGGLK